MTRVRIVGGELMEVVRGIRTAAEFSEGIALDSLSLLGARLQTLLTFLEPPIKLRGEVENVISAVSFGRLRSSLRSEGGAETFASEVLSAYRQLAEFAGVPGVTKDTLVVDYSTNVTGIPEHAINEIERIGSSLVIDAEVAGPQDGFLYMPTGRSLRSLLQVPGTHLLGVSCRQELEAFYLLYTDPRSFSDEVSAAIEAIERDGSLGGSERPGWCEIVGVSKHVRFSLGRQGIHAYGLIDDAVLEVARSEELSHLFGLVRGGLQANLAHSAHAKRGWKDSGHVVMHDTVPYHVIMRSTGYSEPNELKGTLPADGLQRDRTRPEFGDRTPFNHEPHRGAESVNAVGADSISDMRAIAIAEQFVREFWKGATLNPLFCSDGLCLQINTGAALYTLRQLQPRMDYWELRLVGDGTFHSTLYDLLERAHSYHARPD